jgi:electron transfer flavoprotein beta subunit
VAPAAHEVIDATRRLDGGRRELLAVSAPAVVSVEGGTALLRRAGLAALRAALAAPIEVVQPTTPAAPYDAVVHPYRPRARALAAPAGDAALDRLRALTDAGAAASARGEQVTLAPTEAAARIVAALRTWGYLD